ncbi:uncharacterized protein METZ01_LOCUS184143, partial [marine metagenome]
VGLSRNLRVLRNINLLLLLVLINYFMENDTALYTPVNKVSKPATIKSRH